MLNGDVWINPERKTGKVEQRIYGSFIENLGYCIYGGVFDPKSKSSDEAGFRTDVMEAARKMGVSSVRFPGGCYAPYYHFEDGIGPIETRPKTRYRIHYDNPDNSFGTDEYIAWCRKIHAEPFICVNMGTGTAEEARNWVEYCNGTEGSRWADRRIKNGHKEPYGVRLWGLGNEIGGNWELGYCDTADDYVKKAREFAMAMKQADPEIQLIGCGAHFPILDGIYQAPTGYFANPSDNWNREVLDRMFDYLDYINIHDYIGHDYKDDIMSEWKTMGPEKVHEYLMEYMRVLDDAYQIMRQDIRLAQHKHKKFKKIGIALDEYNPWYTADENTCCNYSAADGLLTAAYFNIFIRNADVATLANMAQLVNVLPAMVAEPGGTGFYRTAVSYVQEMYLENSSLTAVDIWTKSPVRKGTYYEEVDYLDCSATYDEAKQQLVVNLINSHLREPLSVTLHIAERKTGKVTGKVFGGIKPDLINDFTHPDVLQIQNAVYKTGKEIILPPMSVSVLKVELLTEKQ